MMTRLRILPAPLLRTLRKILMRCVKLAYMQRHGTPCPPYLSKIRDLSILPRILQEETPWWNLTLIQVADLLRQECDDFYQLLTLDTRTIDAAAMEEVGQSILQYRQLIRQDLPFRLKRLHVWNVSGWTPTQTGNDPKLRLVKRLLHTVQGQFPYKKHAGTQKPPKPSFIIFQVCRLLILQGFQLKEVVSQEVLLY